ncbi:MAG: PadR family transcriptional regulator, partial [Planctomycetota bacterium]
MTVKNSLLAMLAQEPAHGYGLKSSFEKSTAGTWPLNVGQVYQTLNRLERDGLVESKATGETSSRQTWQIT